MTEQNEIAVRLLKRAGVTDPKTLKTFETHEETEKLVNVIRDIDATWEDFAKAFVDRFGRIDTEEAVFMLCEQLEKMENK